METPAGVDLLNSTLFPVIPGRKGLSSSAIEDDIGSRVRSWRTERVPTHRVLKRDSGTSTKAAVGISSEENSRNTNNVNTSLAMNQTRKRLSSTYSPLGYARLCKLFGDLFLLAGLNSEASEW